jgi:uncharacterized protein (TIGR02246 family)
MSFGCATLAAQLQRSSWTQRGRAGTKNNGDRRLRSLSLSLSLSLSCSSSLGMPMTRTMTKHSSAVVIKILGTPEGPVFIHPEEVGMMNKSSLIAMALTLACASAAAAPAPEDAVREVLDAHEQALNKHDIDGLMALYAPGADTVVMGTTPPERWVGKAEIAEAYGHFFEDFDAGTVQRECPWMQVEASGDVGWITANCEYQDALDGKSRSFALNVTAVMQQREGAWKLRAMHFSNPTAPSAP